VGRAIGGRFGETRVPVMNARDVVIDDFLARHGWRSDQRRRLAGDASFRKYDRLEGPQGRAVLMDAPPPHEDVRPFVRIAKHLYGLGFSVPRILAEDHAGGLLLLEDLGDDTYTRLLAKSYDEHALYTLATDALIALHKLPLDRALPAGVPAYGQDRLLEEVDRINAWYRPLAEMAPLSETDLHEYRDIWRNALPKAWAVPSSLVLFDYHVDNLLGLFDRPGVKACGILDFQDAVAGPVTYDLVSLLEDARRDIDPALVGDMKARYSAAFPLIGAKEFNVSWAVMAAQRHTRVIGTFARLKLRDGKPQYLQHLPRLWRYLDQCLGAPELADLKAWFARSFPDPLRRLRAA
jgi:hypothetical protein